MCGAVSVDRPGERVSDNQGQESGFNLAYVLEGAKLTIVETWGGTFGTEGLVMV